MIIRILLTIFLLTPALCLADPFLTCDPQEGVTQYKLGVVGEETISPALASGAAWHDLALFPIGDSDATLAAGAPWVLDGVPQESVEWGPPVPFVLGRPDVPQLPMNTGLRNNH